ncbi:hypothetical protein KM043_018607 [Ampulex compressa]|nr:hypothetical protein KM043_018607 [Ampulex compressa]
MEKLIAENYLSFLSVQNNVWAVVEANCVTLEKNVTAALSTTHASAIKTLVSSQFMCSSVNAAKAEGKNAEMCFVTAEGVLYQIKTTFTTILKQYVNTIESDFAKAFDFLTNLKTHLRINSRIPDITGAVHEVTLIRGHLLYWTHNDEGRVISLPLDNNLFIRNSQAKRTYRRWLR